MAAFIIEVNSRDRPISTLSSHLQLTLQPPPYIRTLVTTFRAHLDHPGSPLAARSLAESHLQSPFAKEGAGDSDVDILGSQNATLFPHTLGSSTTRKTAGLLLLPRTYDMT